MTPLPARDNPFASHRVLAIPYRPEGLGWDDLMERLARLRYRAAIVGPKGAGKTTLLEALAPRLAALGFQPHPIRLDEEHPRLDRGVLDRLCRQLGPGDVVLLDGAEQLSRLAWWRFRWRAARAGGLIIASHRPGRLPTLLGCRPSPQLLAAVVADLLSPGDSLSSDQIESLHRRHCGNIREALRELYDWQAAGGSVSPSDHGRRPGDADSGMA